jgi:uncharacterized membrane protein HdeD (DUF308 family)
MRMTFNWRIHAYSGQELVGTVLRGVLAILFAVFTFANPGITLESLILLFGAFAFADGVLHLIAAVRSGSGNWWALLLAGLFGIGAGLVTFVYPGLTALAFLSSQRTAILNPVQRPKRRAAPPVSARPIPAPK